MIDHELEKVLKIIKKEGHYSFGVDCLDNLSIMNFQILKTVLCFGLVTKFPY